MTVDAIPCDVLSSTVDTITCHLQKKDFSVTSQLETDSMNQVDGYISGVGFNYERWSIGSLWEKNFAGLKRALDSGSHSMLLRERSIKAEL